MLIGMDGNDTLDGNAGNAGNDALDSPQGADLVLSSLPDDGLVLLHADSNVTLL